MMKRSLRVIALLLLVLVSMTSCRRDESMRTALARAEALMESDPHAARAVLDSLENVLRRPSTLSRQPSSPRLSKSDAALYALLRTQADHKCRIRVTSDSLPLVATRYYGTRHKTQRAALAQHYLGCTYSDMHRDLDAIDAFLRATTLFPDTTSRYFANSLFHLGILYTTHDMLDSAWVAFSRYRQTEVCNADSANIGYADYYMGSVAMHKGIDDVADSLFHRVECNTKSTNYIRHTTYYQLAKLYFYRKHDIEMSLAYLDKLGNYFGEENGAVISLKADIMAQNQQSAQAYQLYKKSIRTSSDIYIQCSSYAGLVNIAPLLNHPDSTRFFFDQYKNLLDTIYLKNKQKEIAEIEDKHIVEVHDQQMRARNIRLRLGVGIFIVVLLSAFSITLLLIDRKRKQEKLKYEEALNTIRQKQMDQLAKKEDLSPDAEGYDEEPDTEPELKPVSETPFIALQRERIALYCSQYASSPWPLYLKEHEADIALEKKMNMVQAKELMCYLDTLFSDMFVVMYGSNLNLNKNDLEYCAMVMLGFSTAQMSYCTQATVHSFHCRHGKMKAMLSDEWYQIVYGCKKAMKKTDSFRKS